MHSPGTYSLCAVHRRPTAKRYDRAAPILSIYLERILNVVARWILLGTRIESIFYARFIQKISKLFGKSKFYQTGLGNDEHFARVFFLQYLGQLFKSALPECIFRQPISQEIVNDLYSELNCAAA